MSTNEPNLDTNPDGFDDFETEGEQPNNPDNQPTGDNQPNTPKKLDEMTQEELIQKVKDSAKGAQGLLDEKRNWTLREQELLEQLASKEQGNGGDTPLFPGYENMSDDEKQNFQQYNNSVVDQAEKRLLKNPVLQNALKRDNEAKWEDAYAKVALAYPELNNHKAQFKAENFKPLNVPDNMDVLLTSLAKVFLFDHVRDVVTKDIEERNNRIDDIRNNGGSGGTRPGSQPKRTLAQYEAIAKENPAKFAALKDEYEADLATGKLN